MKRADQMKELLARWEGSGLTQKAFAEREGVKYTTLLYWRRRMGRRREKASTSLLSPVRVVPDGPRPLGGFEVRTSSGLVVSVPHGFDEGELRRLVETLAAC